MKKIDIKRVEEIKSYLEKLKTELIMEGYQDGWTKKWLEDKVVELDGHLNRYKDIIND